MSFYICEQTRDGGTDYWGLNLDWIATFSFKTMIDGNPAMIVRMKDDSTIQLDGRDALKLLYAMQLRPPENKN